MRLLALLNEVGDRLLVETISQDLVDYLISRTIASVLFHMIITNNEKSAKCI